MMAVTAPLRTPLCANRPSNTSPSSSASARAAWPGASSRAIWRPRRRPARCSCSRCRSLEHTKRSKGSRGSRRFQEVQEVQAGFQGSRVRRTLNLGTLALDLWN
jgi:hypothetical protein